MSRSNVERYDKHRSSGSECHACVPPYVFKHKPTENLFQDYSFHLRRSTTSSVLGVYILLTAVLAILYFAYQKTPTEKNLYHVCLCVLGICLYIYINTKWMRSRKQLKIVSYMLWVLLLLLAFISLPLGAWSTVTQTAVNPADGLWQFIFIIYCMYLLLTVNFFMTLPFAITLSLVHIAVVLIRLQDWDLIKQSWTKILVNGVLLFIVNMVGIKEHHSIEKTQRKSFVNCRNYIGAKLESQDQRLRLVKVTEMCLPKFMCSEVCADLTMYHSIVCPRHIFPKVYDCVSIAYINITGLERLKAQLDTAEYINIVNDLSVTFEALCEVYGCLPLTVLGDCFVGISGVPLTDPDGAQACVNLCVDMMQAVELVQHSKNMLVEALTGVHYGSITTGVAGIYRWQYKACSNDTMIARHMALTGSPGKVHITESCIRFLALDQYEVHQSSISHGINIPTYYLQQISSVRKFQLSPPVMKLSRKLSKMGNVNSFLRLNSMESEEPFYTQLSRANDNKPSMTTCLLEGKAFVHRLANDFVESDATTRAFHQAITVGVLDQEASTKMSFFTLKFHDKFMESRFVKEFVGFGVSLAFILILLVGLSVIHFILLPRTMLMLGSILFLFLFISLLLIFLLSTKLNLMKCRCLSNHTNKLALLIIIIFLIICTTVANVLTCQSKLSNSTLPLVFRYPIMTQDDSHTQCPSPHYILLSGVVLLFVIVVTKMSHILQTVLILLSTAGYIVVTTYTHSQLFEIFDKDYNEGVTMPPSSVIAVSALLHFALLHILIGRHHEFTRRLDFIWRHEEMSQYQNAQDMVTLRQGVAENTLPVHVLGHFNSPECVMRPFSNNHKLVGVAFCTIPNFPAFVNDMCNNNQPLAVVQVLHDVTSAFDHLLRRGDFQVVEKVYDQALTYVLVSGVKDSFLNTNQPAIEHDYLIHHLCKLLDLLLDMKHCLVQLNAMSGRNLILRAGVSMGPIVEGVVGFKRPQYNIWGPAVEMARKLELTGKMNHLQVNKEVAQTLKRRFQFQPRSQGSMPVLQDLQPYIVLGRRLQSVIASDNVSVASDANFSPRSHIHDQSLGSISQAETVLVSSQQPLLGSSSFKLRTSSFDTRPEAPNGVINPNNSGSSTPSGSFTRNLSRDSSKDGIAHGWKLPPTPSSIKHSTANRPMSPELPAVHYSKIRTPPSKNDSRGTIILTQANISGSTSNNLGVEPASSSEIVYPSAVNTCSSMPKMANVVNTDSMRLNSPRRQQTTLSPVGELALSKVSNLASPSQSRTTPTSMHSPITGRVTPNSIHSGQGRYTPNGVGIGSPATPPPQNMRMSPALSYTRTTSPAQLPSSASSRTSSIKEAFINRTAPNSYQSEDEGLLNFSKDTDPLLGTHSPHINKRTQHYHTHNCDHNNVNEDYDYKLERCLSGGTSAGRPTAGRQVPVILGLDRIMTTSIYSDKMQTSMEGNVSSTSTSPDDEACFITQKSHDRNTVTNSEINSINNDPSLSPLLKHQLNRFAKNRDGVHKSPHLPRKHSANSVSRSGANTISSLSPPTTPDRSLTGHPTPLAGLSVSYDTASSNKSRSSSGSKSQSSVINKAGWAGARPKQLNSYQHKKTNDGRYSPPPLPIPPPPVHTVTESEMSELSDDDNVNVTSVTDYDNVYSTDTGTYNSRVFLPEKYQKNDKAFPLDASNRFVAKLEKMQTADCSARELYSEIESDAADCESLVGDTDYETEPLTAPPASHDYNHPLQRLQWTENKLLALLKPATGNVSTMGSTLRHCRSMELLPCETDDNHEVLRQKRFSNRRIHSNRASQNLEDNASITSSMLGSEFSRSDPYLSDLCPYESEYDNFLKLEEDQITDKHLDSIDMNQFDNIDFDKIKIGENLTTQDYITSLQKHIDQRQNNQTNSYM